MHALAAVNTPIRGWKTHSEYRMLMVEGNLVVTYLMMLLAMDLRLAGQMLLNAVDIFHYCVLQSEIYKDFNVIITHYIIKPPCVHFDMACLHLPDIDNCTIDSIASRRKSSSISSTSNSSKGVILNVGSSWVDVEIF